MTASKFGLLAACLTICMVAAPLRARAQGALLTVEAAGGAPVGEPQSDRFGVGGAVSAGAHLGVAPWLLIGVRLRAGMLSNGPAPADATLADPGSGSFETLSVLLRLRPFARGPKQRNARGLFLEAGGGGAVTGELVRPAIEAGLGYGVALDDKLALAPVVRFMQIIQSSAPLSSADARVLMIGAELALLDTHPEPPEAPPPPSLLGPEADSDRDGIPDSRDACPAEPEDLDKWSDEDGCPERDNDGDLIEDPNDECPNQPEDRDVFDDDDGCPDPDNDGDGFFDADDQCPEEAEIVNGNKDYDGCADEGLIELRGDRIVLEERVLFDSERARIKSVARPVLKAIVNLYSQHPEWMQIRIEGHADSRGDEKFNQELSERRAEHVRDQLVELGIPGGIIEFVGFGSTRPRDRRGEEDAYQRNRRVEFVVAARGAIAKPGAAPEETPAPAPEGTAPATPQPTTPQPTTATPATAT
ncbi:MAG TPA: OmpA family protein, partial [Polyangiales bacterium]|nr:OmpA family protein [Polyangiales bacterium]